MASIPTASAGVTGRPTPAAAIVRPRRASGPGRWLALALAGLVAGLVALPVTGVAASLFAAPTGAIAHLAETILGEILFNTFAMMAMVGVGVAVIGVGSAWLVTMCRFPGVRALEWLLLLPLAMPAYIIGYAYTDAMAFAGPIQSALRAAFSWSRGDYWFPDVHGVGGVSLMLVLVLYPYVYLLARTTFLDQSTCVLEASRTLGAGPWRAFFRVGLPMARPAVAAGVALALMEALADFGAVSYFGVHTFTTAIYRIWFGMGDKAAAAQLAAALLAFVFLLVAMEALSRRNRRFGVNARRHRAVAPIALKGWKAAAAMAAAAAPVLLGFVLPAAALIRLHLIGGDDVFGPRFIHYAANSFLLASAAALLIVALAAMVAYATRLSPGPATTLAVRAASLGYAVPGAVIAVGLLIPLGQLDLALDGLSRAVFGVGTGLLISGTVIALLYAYAVRFLAVATGPLEAGLGRIPMSVDHAARTLGADAAGVAGRIHAPLLRRSLLTAGLLVFVDVLKELPATLIVRPFNFDTLAVRVYSLASDERLAQAATGSLVIVAIGLLPVIILTQMIRADRRKGERAAH